MTTSIYHKYSIIESESKRNYIQISWMNFFEKKLLLLEYLFQNVHQEVIRIQETFELSYIIVDSI